MKPEYWLLAGCGMIVLANCIDNPYAAVHGMASVMVCCAQIIANSNTRSRQ